MYGYPPFFRFSLFQIRFQTCVFFLMFYFSIFRFVSIPFSFDSSNILSLFFSKELRKKLESIEQEDGEVKEERREMERRDRKDSNNASLDTVVEIEKY